MTYRTLRKLLKYFVSIPILLLLTGTLIYCAWMDFDNRELSSFAPEVIHNDAYKPFFYTNDYFYNSPEFVSTDFKETNLNEWYIFFDSKVTKADLEMLMYAGDSNLNDLHALILNLSHKIPAPSSIFKYASNGILKVADTKKQMEFLRYLYYARRCEPYVIRYKENEWETVDPFIGPQPEKDSLLADGQKLLKEVKSSFIRQRCHFQIVRMLYMSGDYDGCTTYLASHKKEIEGAGTLSIRYRTMSYAALAAHYSKHYAISNYLYSRIFDSFPPLRQNAMLFYHPAEDSDWHQSLAMATTPHEKAVLWAMTGIANLDEPTAISEIYKLEPSSDLLDLLLVRAANLAEGMNTPSDEQKMKMDTAYRRHAYEVIKRNMSDERLHNPALWSLCAGYCNNDMDDADRFYDRAISQARGDTLLIAQVHLLQVWNRIYRTTQIDTHTDSMLLADLIWVEQRDAPLRTSVARLSIREAISGLYLQAHDTMMAQVAVGHLWLDYFTLDSNAYHMIAFIENKAHTPLQDYLIRGYSTSTYDMWYALGMIDIFKGDLSAAKTKWLRSGNLTGDTLFADPFLIHIRDCHDCDHDAAQKKRYSRMDFLDNMIGLERTAQANKSKAAETYYQMANGFYNITYSGNNRMFYSNCFLYGYEAAALEGSNGYYGPTPLHGVSSDSLHIATTDVALRYYLKARDTSRDKEFKARCTYMAAKCSGFNYQEPDLTHDQVDELYSPYFKELQEKYSNTAYARDLIHECTYFRNYMAHFRK
ncbi:MAG: hypothetical protein JWO03_473 [Bacteroidetes bacterium]|nr:hypothetical protein [Bacteroidota bacterium]